MRYSAALYVGIELLQFLQQLPQMRKFYLEVIGQNISTDDIIERVLEHVVVL